MTHAPSLAIRKTVEALPHRREPYWNILEYCRHIGLEKRCGRQAYWVARIRKSDGRYKQARLAALDYSGTLGVGYGEAICLAHRWFAKPEIASISARSYPVGPRQSLDYTPKGVGFTVGDALLDYVEWKRIAAAESHFLTNLSLINHHIIPQLGDVQVEDLTSRQITSFSLDVLQSAPKRGNRELGPSRDLSEIDPEALRKRKKTLNALIGILRLAIRLAWENGDIQSERAWRCIRSVPNADKPRNIVLDRTQCTRLLSCCREDLRQLVQGALYTGCRAGELAALQVRDVASDIFGIYVGPSKSRRARYVYLPDEGMAFFLGLCAGRAPEEHVFLMQSGRNWHGNHKHLFKDAVRQAGISESFVFHGLRHTYASQLVQAGTPLLIVAKQLGHANTDTVSRTYGHLSPNTCETEIRSRFAPLSQTMAEAAGSKSKELDRIRSSLQSGYSVEARLQKSRSSWPRSNFNHNSDPLIRLLRDR
jgi:integrase/recombinase XerD